MRKQSYSSNKLSSNLVVERLPLTGLVINPTLHFYKILILTNNLLLWNTNLFYYTLRGLHFYSNIINPSIFTAFLNLLTPDFFKKTYSFIKPFNKIKLKKGLKLRNKTNYTTNYTHHTYFFNSLYKFNSFKYDRLVGLWYIDKTLIEPTDVVHNKLFNESTVTFSKIVKKLKSQIKVFFWHEGKRQYGHSVCSILTSYCSNKEKTLKLLKKLKRVRRRERLLHRLLTKILKFLHSISRRKSLFHLNLVSEPKVLQKITADKKPYSFLRLRVRKDLWPYSAVDYFTFDVYNFYKDSILRTRNTNTKPNMAVKPSKGSQSNRISTHRLTHKALSYTSANLITLLFRYISRNLAISQRRLIGLKYSSKRFRCSFTAKLFRHRLFFLTRSFHRTLYYKFGKRYVRRPKRRRVKSLKHGGKRFFLKKRKHAMLVRSRLRSCIKVCRSKVYSVLTRKLKIRRNKKTKQNFGAYYLYKQLHLFLKLRRVYVQDLKKQRGVFKLILRFAARKSSKKRLHLPSFDYLKPLAPLSQRISYRKKMRLRIWIKKLKEKRVGFYPLRLSRVYSANNLWIKHKYFPIEWFSLARTAKLALTTSLNCLNKTPNLNFEFINKNSIFRKTLIFPYIVYKQSKRYRYRVKSSKYPSIVIGRMKFKRIFDNRMPSKKKVLLKRRVLARLVLNIVPLKSKNLTKSPRKSLLKQIKKLKRLIKVKSKSKPTNSFKNSLKVKSKSKTTNSFKNPLMSKLFIEFRQRSDFRRLRRVLNDYKKVFMFLSFKVTPSIISKFQNNLTSNLTILQKHQAIKLNWFKVFFTKQLSKRSKHMYYTSNSKVEFVIKTFHKLNFILPSYGFLYISNLILDRNAKSSVIKSYNKVDFSFINLTELKREQLAWFNQSKLLAREVLKSRFAALDDSLALDNTAQRVAPHLNSLVHGTSPNYLFCEQLEWNYLTESSELLNKQTTYLKQVTVKRIRFKPGYSKIWRVARTSFKQIHNLSFKYQYRLTRYLVRLYRSKIWRYQSLLPLKLLNVLNDSLITTDKEINSLFLENNWIYINGYPSSNPDFALSVGDFIQLVVHLKYYITYKWILNWTLVKQNRFKHRIRSKFSGISRRLDKQSLSSYPDWLLDLDVRVNDVAKYLEVDYLSMSIFVILDPIILDTTHLTKLKDKNLLITNMYNWKYIT